MTDPVAGDPLDISARVPAGCPVIHLDASPPLEVGSHWQKANELREISPTFFNTHAQGYWVFTRYDEVREMYQHPEIFSSEVIIPWDPEPAYRFVPTQIDPPGARQVPPADQPLVRPQRGQADRAAGPRDRPAPGVRPRSARGSATSSPTSRCGCPPRSS